MSVAPHRLHDRVSAAAPERLWAGEHPIPPFPEAREINGGFVTLDGDRFYRISQYDALPPFFMTLVSAFDHWLFISSTGGLTAGRGDPERAIFPYVTVDRIHDAAGSTGGFTILRVTRGDRTSLWEPFAPAGRTVYRLSRHLSKSVVGHRLCFEEINHDLGLTFRTEWSTSGKFGFLKRASVVNDGTDRVAVGVLDGMRNLVPAGVPARLMESMSCLTDAYKLAEVVPQTSLAVYAITAGITDQAIAQEALRATVAWSDGLPGARVVLTESQVAAFRRGEVPRALMSARGVRGLYGVCATFDLPAGEAHRWLVAADQGLDQVAVAALAERLALGGAGVAAEADAAENARRLRAIVGSADGLQCGGDEMVAASHFANVLFNVMRGGVFVRGYALPAADFARFVEQRNRGVAADHRPWLDGLARDIGVQALASEVRARGDANLERLFLEYLPLGFSRRHGDPSRPWNRFSIRLCDASGAELLEYQGNWRDIFQNWEALGTSFPAFLGHMVAKFVNGSTIDGYNAYRVTRGGVEWEEPAPEDPWATIGYWGDHQVIYLLALLEWAERFAPGRFHEWLEREVFAYTAVPYRIAGYDAMRRDPRATITFVAEQHEQIREREAREGTDARLVRGPDGHILHVNLTEKLLLVALVRLANLVPGGGIWMNTQRPEWNDANNALVGFGVSTVTLAQLRRYLVFCRRLFGALGERRVRLSAAVAEFASDLTGILAGFTGREAASAADPVERRRCVDALSALGTRYRERVYTQGLGGPAEIESAALLRMLDVSIPMVDASLRAARRSDGLFHAYRLLSFTREDSLPLRDLRLMLEGQVAVLGSGLLAPAEAVDLLAALRRSALYRADQHTYLLYPDGNPAGFLARNTVPGSSVERVPLLAALLRAGDDRLVRRDVSGVVRFHPDLVNEAALEERLARLAAEASWAPGVAADADGVRAVYEEVFQHHAFLGRSGAMFAYEGLGSVYWHMVSKLLVAVQECHAAAHTAGDPAADALAAAYHDIRAGLGFHKSPSEYGAFPSDPYSHTPGHAGAQQPGMTGQAKEGVLARRGELGVYVDGGALRFAPTLLSAAEFSTRPQTFRWFDVGGREVATELPADTLAFTICATLVVYHAVDRATSSTITLLDGSMIRFNERTLPPDHATSVFLRAGTIARIDVEVERTELHGEMHTAAHTGARPHPATVEAR